MEYFTLPISWKSVTSISDTNKPTTTSTTIKGRMELGYTLVRDQTGEEIVSTACIFTKSAVAVNDYVNDKLVISSIPEISLDGTVHHYEVYVK